MVFVKDGCWDFSGYDVITLGEPHISVRCLCVVSERAWCAYRNQVYVIIPETLGTEVITLGCDIKWISVALLLYGSNPGCPVVW